MRYVISSMFHKPFAGGLLTAAVMADAFRHRPAGPAHLAAGLGPTRGITRPSSLGASWQLCAPDLAAAAVSNHSAPAHRLPWHSQQQQQQQPPW
jgi:hypothetical protein